MKGGRYAKVICSRRLELLWNGSRVGVEGEIESYADRVSYRVSFEVSELPQ